MATLVLVPPASLAYRAKAIAVGRVLNAFFAFDGSNNHLIVRSLRGAAHRRGHRRRRRPRAGGRGDAGVTRNHRRRLFAPTELPVGAITALVGAPYLLWLLARANPVGRGG